MSYGSTGISSSRNNGMEGEVMGSRPIECMCNRKSFFIFLLGGGGGWHAFFSSVNVQMILFLNNDNK